MLVKFEANVKMVKKERICANEYFLFRFKKINILPGPVKYFIILLRNDPSTHKFLILNICFQFCIHKLLPDVIKSINILQKKCGSMILAGYRSELHRIMK